MEVWPGGRAGRADIPDQVASRDPLACGEALGHRAQMRVARHHIRTVGDFHGSAVATKPAHVSDAAGCGGVNRSCMCGGEIDAGVHADITVDRVPAAPEDRAQPRALDRLGEDAHHFSVTINRGAARSVLRPDDLIDHVAKIERRKGDRGLAHDLGAHAGFAPEQAQRLAPTKVAPEVNIAAQHLR